jgi:hypothetical protein
MRSSQNALLAALLRAQRFLAENLAQLAKVVDLSVARKRLDDVIASFITHAVDQENNKRSAKGETEKQRQLRLTLRTEQMAPIAEIARRNLRAVPEFKALQMPSRWAKGAAFLGGARSMAEAAVIHKDALLERGLPADSLDQFQDLLAKLEESGSDRHKSRAQHIGATKALLFEEQEGRSVLKVLDALVRRALAGNEALLGTWSGAIRTASRRPAVATTQSSTASSTPVVAPASTATASTTASTNAATPPATAA